MYVNGLLCHCSAGALDESYADLAFCITPTADDLKAELLAHGVKPPPSSGPPSGAVRQDKAASSDAASASLNLLSGEGAVQPETHHLAAFPQSSSCPSEFWGEHQSLIRKITLCVLHSSRIASEVYTC